MSQEATTTPFLTVAELATRWRKTHNAIYLMRHQRRGPKSFRLGKQVLFEIAAVEAYEAEQKAADSRSNPDLDPTQQPTQARRPRRKAATA